MKLKDANESFLWHLRYGHLNYDAFRLLKDVVIGLPFIEKRSNTCEGCIYEKFHWLPFPKTAWRTREPVELVHADVYGPLFSITKDILFSLLMIITG